MIIQLRKRRAKIIEVIEFYQKLRNPIPREIIENAGRIAFMSSHLASGSIYDYQFAGECQRRGFVPCWDTFKDDNFFSGNSRKLSYLYIADQFGNVQKLANAGHWNGKKLSEIILDSGQSLVDFHLERWKEIPGKKMMVEMSEWLKFFGSASDYYPHVMVLYAFFSPWISPNYLGYKKGERERLEQEAISPALDYIKSKWGVEPLIQKFDLKPVLF